MQTLIWFQRDLRIHANPALNHALRQGQPVVAVYIHSPGEDEPWSEGAASRWWLHHSLERLSSDLLSLGIRLQFFNADSRRIIPQLVQDYQVDMIVWTNRHEPHRIDCEDLLEKELLSKGLQVQRCTDSLLTRPMQFLTASKNTPYRVFTPFYNKLRSQLDLSAAVPSSSGLRPHEQTVSSAHPGALSLEELGLLDRYAWHQKLHAYWSPGEKEALKKLDLFIEEPLGAYIAQRDFPAIHGTSGLSAHLHFGEISPLQIVHALAPLIEFSDSRQANAAEAFLRQLIWREFARYILRHFPATTTQPMNPKFNSAFWNEDNASLKLWQRGLTGIPIIDAGMRELWETGIMHNRVRMLVASVLTKNMGIAWQQGARWFWDTLVDADLANNTMGWQWVAGCGVDAAPYFRIFNPNTQAAKFDPEHRYVQHWLNDTDRSNLLQPAIDLGESRKQALARYQQLKSE